LATGGDRGPHFFGFSIQQQPVSGDELRACCPIRFAQYGKTTKDTKTEGFDGSTELAECPELSRTVNVGSEG
jgi:hypothetical protein